MEQFHGKHLSARMVPSSSHPLTQHPNVHPTPHSCLPLPVRCRSHGPVPSPGKVATTLAPRCSSPAALACAHVTRARTCHLQWYVWMNTGPSPGAPPGCLPCCRAVLSNTLPAMGTGRAPGLWDSTGTMVAGAEGARLGLAQVAGWAQVLCRPPAQLNTDLSLGTTTRRPS